MRKSDIFWQTYLNLEREAIELSKYIFITDEKLVNKGGKQVAEPCSSQLETFSPHIADLLVRCCVQIEAVSKEIYYEHGGTKTRGDNTIFFDEDCLKLIDIKWATHNKRVLVVAPFFNLTNEENKTLRPLKEAHKKGGTYWERAYQAVKHDRYSSLSKGNVKAFLQAMAALYLLNIYYRNDSWITKIQDLSKHDYSMGSSLFSVKTPVVNQLWYGNKPVVSDSPFVVQYVDADYKKIEETRHKGEQRLNNYVMSQPEWKEKPFLAQLAEAAERQHKDPKQKLITVFELSKYKLNKKIPATLPFEERKNMLINSKEYHGWIYQHNSHISPEEITKDNIQREIDKVASCQGMEIEKNNSNLEWISYALTSASCKVYIPE